uniref:Signal-induced proliferation-associated 1-like protein C-terminal domain-containing protein n=1 Tax=Catharus ustulatus TaxID=91951 RepID=A0A8C3UYN2_CATUS
EHPGHSGNSGSSGNSGNSGNSGHSDEPLWHVPAPARIPGKRPARPEPGGKDSPNRLHKVGNSQKNLPENAWNSQKIPQKIPPPEIPQNSQKSLPKIPWNSQKKSWNSPQKSPKIFWNFEKISEIPKRISPKIPGISKKFPKKSPQIPQNSQKNVPKNPWNFKKIPKKCPPKSNPKSPRIPKKFLEFPKKNSQTNPPKIPVIQKSSPKNSPPKSPRIKKIPQNPPEFPKKFQNSQKKIQKKMQVNVFGQPRLRASLRDLRSPRRVPKSSIEDDLKRLILMDNSCPEPETATPLQRTLSDESLCGSRRDNPGNCESQLREFPENFPGGFPGSSTLPHRRGQETRKGQDLGEIWGILGKFGGPVARLEPGLMPLPDTAGLEWATLVSAAKAYEVQRAVSLFSLTDPALSPEPPPAPPPPPRAAPSPAPLDLPGKVSQLEAMLKQLHSDLEKEKQDKVFLQAEVANLRQNNRRLQQESSSAARQLRRFARIFSGNPEHQEP